MIEPTGMSMARLEALLDAYGADPKRWPAEERSVAEALLATSAEARRHLAEAAALDDLLDSSPIRATGPELADRILATLDPAPVPRLRVVSTRPASRRATWRWATTIAPMAAAALLVLWLRGSEVSDRSEVADWSDQSDTSDFASLGTYVTPTDVLLEAPSAGAIDTVPGFGCTDSGLGCIEKDDIDERSALDTERYV